MKTGLQIACLMLLSSMIVPPSGSARQGRAEHPVSLSYLPKSMHLWIGGFVANYTVTLEGKQLRYELHEGDKKTIEYLKPTPADWKRFWKALDTVHIRKWKKRYEDPNAADGTAWGIQIDRGKQNVSLKISGANAYPDDRNVANTMLKPEPSGIFDQYLKAVRSLIGNRTFN